jgi:hypothetical protein
MFVPQVIDDIYTNTKSKQLSTKLINRNQLIFTINKYSTSYRLAQWSPPPHTYLD